MSGDPLSAGQQLVEALQGAAPGAVIMLDEARYDLAADIRLDRAVTLRGLPDAPPILHFVDGRFALSIMADDCHLQSIAVTSSGHRGTPLIRVEADDCSLVGVVITTSQGSGLEADGCQRLTIDDLVVLDCGQRAAGFTRCRDMRISLHAHNIAQRTAAPAIHLLDCADFTVDADIAEVNGGAVTIENSAENQVRTEGRLKIRARKVQRALSVLGKRQAPVRSMEAQIAVADWSDPALLLSNVEGAAVDLTLHASPGPANAARLNGGFGVRSSRLDLRHPADLSPLIMGQEDNPDIVIHKHVQDAPTEADDGPMVVLSEALMDNLKQIPRPVFTPYDMADRCSLCGWEGLFRRTQPSERESLACGACRATLRYRGQATALLEHLGEGRFDTLAELVDAGVLAGLDIFEPGFVGPFRRLLGKARRYEQSFYDPDLPSGATRDGMSCQDLMATSFADNSFDLIVTSDIFEHIRKPFLGFAEMRRILRPGGVHVWSVPIGMPPPQETRARVDTSGPEDIMLLPPVYHGSGDDNLSLVYTDFGRDIGLLLSAIGLPTSVVRHRVVNDRVAGVTFISVKAEPVAA